MNIFVCVLDIITDHFAIFRLEYTACVFNYAQVKNIVAGHAHGFGCAGPSQELLEAHTALAVAQYALAANLGLLTPAQFGVSDPAFDADEHLDDISHKILSMDVE